MSTIWKKALAAAAAIAAATSLAACSSASGRADAEAPGQREEVLELDVQYSIFNGPLNRAAAANLQPEGLKVNYIDGAGIDVGQGLTTGSFDLAQWGEVGPVTSFVNGGEDIRVIGSTDANGAAHTILVGPDSTAQSIADLKGGTVVFSRSTNAYLQFLKTIEEAGLQESDFTIVESVPDQIAALISGEVDFIISIEPISSSFVETKGLRELTNGEGKVDNYYPLVTTQTIIDEKREALEIYAAALREHLAYGAANPEEEAALVADFNDTSIDVALAAGEKVSSEFILIDDAFLAKESALVDFFVETGAFAEAPEGFDVIFDRSFNDILAGS